MDNQTVFQAGNSLAVTIPKKLMEKMAWKKGKKVFVTVDQSQKTVTISETPIDATGLTPDYFRWRNSFLDKNKILLKRLSLFHGA